MVGGTPGTGEAPGFVGDPNADEDGDGVAALLEYAQGGKRPRREASHASGSDRGWKHDSVCGAAERSSR